MEKYQSISAIRNTNRSWPDKGITQAPQWCSVDLRDGNQALVNPMSPEQKLKFFKMLVNVGFREIEICFPSASKADYDFTRKLIDEGHIPRDVTVQILTQARKHLIEKSFDALRGAKRAVIHLYNSTSPAQREIVFRKSKKEIIDLAVDGAMMVRECAQKHDGEIVLEYSPESFSQTEVAFASEICSAVVEAWAPEEDEQVIINLPSTVEVASPHVFADQIEYMHRTIAQRDRVILSVHTHNDRGCAVAAAELAQLAGAQRVEGTLFGNGERTGNADLITMALNCFSQGIDPKLSLTDLAYIEKVYSECTEMSVSPRHPYAGELVFTAFSGSHQDAISKGLANYNEKGGVWNVPYLPIDPGDIGRSYEAIIRINSQSGKGGSAYILEQFYGFKVPKEMGPELGAAIQRCADEKGAELLHSEIYECFRKEFINLSGGCSLVSIENQPKTRHNTDKPHGVNVKATVIIDGQSREISGSGNGTIDAFTRALKTIAIDVKVLSYSEHSLSEGSQAGAAAYMCVQRGDGVSRFGVGVDTDITTASVKALVSAINRP
ncbi:2-isopropylmalate synthase [Chitinispirillales bacterium ANBcel5]|uniref:2-isopropylmalate synthase n=1 Tax=Cellulosispirillum alkaliphilum TaxID=3039283 RepID=UPI002A530850|nr:2-isopropylmalate synthase [Chitinispirillales bacterium ANBcel5]